MSVVKINAITVQEGKGPELEERFAKRARGVEQMEGFEEFQLLRPLAGENRYFVYTRWESEEAFRRWAEGSETFRRCHAQAAQTSTDGPVAVGSDLLSFEVLERIGPS